MLRVYLFVFFPFLSLSLFFSNVRIQFVGFYQMKIVDFKHVLSNLMRIDKLLEVSEKDWNDIVEKLKIEKFFLLLKDKFQIK